MSGKFCVEKTYTVLMKTGTKICLSSGIINYFHIGKMSVFIIIYRHFVNSNPRLNYKFSELQRHNISNVCYLHVAT